MPYARRSDTAGVLAVKHGYVLASGCAVLCANSQCYATMAPRADPQQNNQRTPTTTGATKQAARDTIGIRALQKLPVPTLGHMFVHTGSLPIHTNTQDNSILHLCWSCRVHTCSTRNYQWHMHRHCRQHTRHTDVAPWDLRVSVPIGVCASQRCVASVMSRHSSPQQCRICDSDFIFQSMRQ